MNKELRVKRKEKRMSQNEIAHKAGISLKSYQRVESGEQKPSVYVAIRIADALGVKDIRELFRVEETGRA